MLTAVRRACLEACTLIFAHGWVEIYSSGPKTTLPCALPCSLSKRPLHYIYMGGSCLLSFDGLRCRGMLVCLLSLPCLGRGTHRQSRHMYCMYIHTRLHQHMFVFHLFYFCSLSERQACVPSLQQQFVSTLNPLKQPHRQSKTLYCYTSSWLQQH